jgi:hypothetical protein
MCYDRGGGVVMSFLGSRRKFYLPDGAGKEMKDALNKMKNDDVVVLEITKERK